jgi:anaerobic magnesium-protoporphyrin IX monomethyl ester cyclase
VVHHEGEITLAELLERFPDGMPDSGALDDFAGVALRTNVGEIRVNPRRRYILNLDELPDPARDLVDMNRYLETWRRHNGYASMTISVSRGCPYGCRWCQESVHGDSLRMRSPQSVAQEVKSLLQRYRIDRLRLVDDVDGLDREWLEAWETAAQEIDAVLPFEALNDLERRDIPMLDVRDSL